MRCGHYVVSHLTQTSILEWYMVKFVLENGHQIDTCHDKIGICAQYRNIVTFSAININKRTLTNKNEKDILHFNLFNDFSS